MYELIPEELKRLKNWVVWKAVPDPKAHSGIKKVPINPKTGGQAQSNNPETWTDFETAERVSRDYAGIGFMFEGSGYFGVDLDDMLEEMQACADGDFDNVIGEFITTLKSYTELSQSGNGLHIICKGKLPEGRRKNGKFEMYDSGRFFVMTGNCAMDSMHHLGDTIDETEDSLSDLTDTTQNTNRILDDTSDSVSETDDNIDDMTDTVDDADTKFGTWQATLANLASTALQRIIDKCTELAKSVVELGIDFTGTMSEVQAISGASDEDLQMLEETARHFGATTKFSATEAAEGLKYMSMAGWTAEQSASALGGVLDLAAASGEELGTTSDIVTDAMTAFGMQADEAGHFADVLATASSNANTNVSMLGESFKYCAPVAGSMGANVEDVSIALGLMANAGIKGSAAGNSLKNALVNLVKPTKQQAAAMANLGLMNTEMVRTFDDEAITKAQSKVADKTGELEKKQIAYNQAVQKYGAESAQAQSKLIDIEKAERNLTEAQDALTKAQEGTIEAIQTGGNVFTDEEGNMKSLSEIMNILRENLGGLDADMTDEEGNLRDLDEVISELSQTEEGLTQAQQLQNAAILFGKQNLSGMLAVINASEEDYNKLADAIYNSEDAASNMAKTMNDNLKGDLASMNSAWEEFKLKIFDSVESPLRNVVQFITTVPLSGMPLLILSRLFWKASKRLLKLSGTALQMRFPPLWIPFIM